jgi:hypothetical protein
MVPKVKWYSHIIWELFATFFKIRNSFYYYCYSKPNANFKARKTPEKEFNINNTPIKTHCDACDLTFATQKGIDDHYKNPKCLKVQQLKQNMKKTDNIPTETEGSSMSLPKNSNHQIYLYIHFENRSQGWFYIHGTKYF